MPVACAKRFVHAAASQSALNKNHGPDRLLALLGIGPESLPHLSPRTRVRPSVSGLDAVATITIGIPELRGTIVLEYGREMAAEANPNAVRAPRSHQHPPQPSTCHPRLIGRQLETAGISHRSCSRTRQKPIGLRLASCKGTCNADPHVFCPTAWAHSPPLTFLLVPVVANMRRRDRLFTSRCSTMPASRWQRVC